MELVVAVFMVTLPFLLPIGQSIRFDIESGRTKCISEDVAVKSMTVGQYSVVNPNEGSPLPESHKIYVMVFSPKGDRIHNATDIESGQFSLHVVEEGNHMACFIANKHQPPVNVSVDFTWRSGVVAKDWLNVAKKGSLEAMELELKKMENVINSIDLEIFILRKRERDMQALNRKTNNTMGYLSLITLILSLSVSGLQIWHLKSFFEKKKII